jgi:hypothetical protein
MTRRLQNLGPNIQFAASEFLVDARGTTKRDDIDLKIREAPGPARQDLIAFRESIEKFLRGLEVPLPAERVEPGTTWKASRPLPIDATWRELRVLPSRIWVGVESAVVEVTFTYAGIRRVNGADQAVVRLEGETTPQLDGATGAEGRLSGTAVIDLATGQIVEEDVTVQMSAELVALNTVVVKIRGTVAAHLRRK